MNWLRFIGDVMAKMAEDDFEAGHPARCDYDPESPAAKEWARRHVSLKGERDFAVDHPAALDTPGNLNHIEWSAGVDPFHPEREAFTGRNPAQAAAARQAAQAAAVAAKPTPARKPLDAHQVLEAYHKRLMELGIDDPTEEQYEKILRDINAQPTESEV